METEYLGYAAGILTTFAFLPQAYRMIRTRQTRDISLTWVGTMNAGVFLWLCYGILKQSMSMIAANGVTLLLLLIILVVKVRYRNHTDAGMHPENKTPKQK
ncbi:MAG: SemiSWEET transporter [Chlorobiaceae bacterium]|nr:SemiSWEET transporter [Chlorobiaceae bacterium]